VLFMVPVAESTSVLWLAEVEALVSVAIGFASDGGGAGGANVGWTLV
jgi:hypothetical protein